MLESWATLFALLGKSLSKIFLSLLGTTLFFCIVPQSRVLKLFVIAIIASLTVGILSHQFGIVEEWGEAVSHSISFLFGFFSFTILTVFKKFHYMISNDYELINGIYRKVKNILAKIFDIDFGNNNNEK